MKKLDPEKKKQIKEALASGMFKPKDLVKLFGVSESLIEALRLE